MIPKQNAIFIMIIMQLIIVLIVIDKDGNKCNKV